MWGHPRKVERNENQEIGKRYWWLGKRENSHETQRWPAWFTSADETTKGEMVRWDLWAQQHIERIYHPVSILKTPITCGLRSPNKSVMCPAFPVHTHKRKSIIYDIAVNQFVYYISQEILQPTSTNICTYTQKWGRSGQRGSIGNDSVGFRWSCRTGRLFPFFDDVFNEKFSCFVGAAY